VLKTMKFPHFQFFPLPRPLRRQVACSRIPDKSKSTKTHQSSHPNHRNPSSSHILHTHHHQKCNARSRQPC
jgi:hypothetical protein